jgi:hypothetical protein
VSEVMGQEPYKSARRVFWIMDNCSAHRGQKAAGRFPAQRGLHAHGRVHGNWWCLSFETLPGNSVLVGAKDVRPRFLGHVESVPLCALKEAFFLLQVPSG